MCLLVTAGLLGFITLEPRVVNAAGIIIYVDDDNILGPWIGTLTNPYNKIQDGVNASNPGDTVFVFNGTYYENVVVDKSINLTGEDREITIIDGGGSGNTVHVTSNWVNITGFTVTGSGSAPNAGINLDHIQNCYIFNNKVSNNLHNGIYLMSSSNNDITKNNISSNGWDGINLYNSSDNKITNNNISSNSQDGIYFYLSNNNIFTNNTVSSNDNEGFDLDSSNNNIITNNNVSNNSEGIHISSSVGNIVNGNCVSSSVVSGILLGYSYNNTIMNNVVTFSNRLTPPFAIASVYLFASTANKIINNTISWNNMDGIFLDADFVPSSDDNIIADNTVLSNNGHGIHLHYPSKNNTITNNLVSNNLGYGIYLDDSPTSKLMNNIVTNNIEGIYLASSYNGTVTGNTVFSNQNRGISIFGCVNDNYVSNNVFLNGGDGLSLRSSININVTNNIISNNANGIYLWLSSNDNIITNNNISNNFKGINVSSSSKYNIIVKNIVSNNFYGICLEGSSNNSIYHNNIIDNTNQAIDDTNNDNQWDNGYPSGGNYWSDFDEPSEGAYDDYQGVDQNILGSDGKVDNGTIGGGGKNPYVIDSDSQDIYPLINPLDTFPPTITNLQPPDGTTTNDNTSTIGADYSDPSGINVSSVVLIVDGLDVTSFATVTASGVSFIPGTALSDGIHTVYLEVKDNVDNLATETWSFTVDTLPPIITNLQPPDSSTSNDNIPTISADYSDPSGINVSSVVLIVDGLDVTLSTTVTANGVSYIPVTALSDGIHTVYLEVKDNVDNLATATWSFTVITALPPATNLTTKVVNNGNNVELEWDPPSSLALDHYLIYRADSATEFDFTTPHNISTTWPNPKNFTWVDPDPNITAVDDDFYYIVRAANFDESIVSLTSNTAGVWTRTFESGISTFSLPLEPFVKKDTEFYSQDMNASYIKWMNQTTHTWMRHDKGSSKNNTIVEIGKGYEIGFLSKSIQTKYTFTGLPGAMILYDSVPFGFDATPLTGDADSLTAKVDNNGNVTLNWTKPTNIGSGDQYYVLRSTLRDGFWGTLGVNYTQLAVLPFNVLSYQDIGNATPGTEYYYMIVPVNFTTGERGVSSYSIGVWTAGYLNQCDTFALPLKLSNYQTTDWYCDKIPDTIGINYYIYSEQRWGWHSTRMPKGAFDPFLVMTEGYQISTTGLTKFTFIGI